MNKFKGIGLTLALVAIVVMVAPQTSLAATVDLKINGTDAALKYSGEQELSLSWAAVDVRNCDIYVARGAQTKVSPTGATKMTVPSSAPYVSFNCTDLATGTSVSDYVYIIDPKNSNTLPAAANMAKTGTASLNVKVKGVPNDWRAESGIQAYLFDNNSTVFVQAAPVKKGVAKFSKLSKNAVYTVVLNAQGYKDMSKSFKASKKNNTLSFNLPTSAEETETALLQLWLTGSVSGIQIGKPGGLILAGQPVKVTVVPQSRKPGKIEVYLVNDQQKSSLLLASTFYRPDPSGYIKTLNLQSPPLSYDVPEGGGYWLEARFISDDGTVRASSRSMGMIKVITKG